MKQVDDFTLKPLTQNVLCVERNSLRDFVISTVRKSLSVLCVCVWRSVSEREREREKGWILVSTLKWLKRGTRNSCRKNFRRKEWKQKVNFCKFWSFIEFFFHPLPRPSTYSYRPLIDGMARIFPTSYAATGIKIALAQLHFFRDLSPGCSTDWAIIAVGKSSKLRVPANWLGKFMSVVMVVQVVELQRHAPRTQVWFSGALGFLIFFLFS